MGLGVLPHVQYSKMSVLRLEEVVGPSLRMGWESDCLGGFRLAFQEL